MSLCFLFLLVVFLSSLCTSSEDCSEERISRFQQYLRIRTVQPSPDYVSAVSFLKEQFKRIGGFVLKEIEFKKGKPMLIATYPGRDSNKKSLLLSSHMDVVPVDESQWKYDPFEAKIDENGDIIARGTQDMKSIGMSHIEALESLIKEGFIPECDIHVLFTVDEEIGGSDGIISLQKSPLFHDMNIGLVIDEGGPSEMKDVVDLYYGEKSATWVKYIAYGDGGHGSQFISNNAANKLIRLMQKILNFREAQEMAMKLKGNDLGNAISVNIDGFRTGDFSEVGGYSSRENLNKESKKSEGGSKSGELFQYNVVPQVAELYLDIRTPPSVSWDSLLKLLEKWRSYDDDVEFVVESFVEENPITDISDNESVKKLQRFFEGKGMEVRMKINSVFTDSRVFRWNGIDAIGMSLMGDTKFLLHSTNEYINRETYLEMIELTKGVILSLST